MPSRRAWTIVAVLFALTPVFFFLDGVRLQISEVDMPMRLFIALLPGLFGTLGAVINEWDQRR